MRNWGGGEETIEDERTQSLLRRLAARVHIKAMATAMVLTGLALLFSR
jgi:hypothetical protein